MYIVSVVCEEAFFTRKTWSVYMGLTEHWKWVIKSISITNKPEPITMLKTITCTYTQHGNNNTQQNMIHCSINRVAHWCVCGAVFSSCLLYHLSLLGGRWTALCHIVLCTRSKYWTTHLWYIYTCPCGISHCFRDRGVDSIRRDIFYFLWYLYLFPGPPPPPSPDIKTLRGRLHYTCVCVISFI